MGLLLCLKFLRFDFPITEAILRELELVRSKSDILNRLIERLNQEEYSFENILDEDKLIITELNHSMYYVKLTLLKFKSDNTS